MKNRQHLVMELFFYAIVVIVGIVLLFMRGVNEAGKRREPPAQISAPAADTTTGEGGGTYAVLLDQ